MVNIYFMGVEHFHQQSVAEYIQVVEYFFFLVALLSVLVVLSIFVAPFVETTDKRSSYECGFEPFGDARSFFDVHFFVVGILFLIFDLEVVFLYPWIYAVTVEGTLSSVGVLGFLIFLFLLGLGFVYEWRKGALHWSPSL